MAAALATTMQAGASTGAPDAPLHYVLADRYTPPDATSYDGFGGILAVEGDTVMVGAYGVSHGIAHSRGAVYVLSLESGRFELEQTLAPPSDAERDEDFGVNLAFNGEVALVASGAQFAQTSNFRGWVRAYRGGVGGWVLARQLAASPAAFHGAFGAALAVEGDTVAVGAPGTVIDQNPGQGCVVVFDDAMAGWTSDTITAPGGRERDFFGVALALSEGTLLVGVPGARVEGVEDAGAVDLFRRSESGWVHAGRLKEPTPFSGSYFGWRLAERDGVLLVAAGLLGDPQTVHVYARSGDSWVWSDRLPFPPSSTLTGGVSVGAGRVAVGVTTRDEAGVILGWEVLVFRQGTEGWTLAARVRPPQTAPAGLAMPVLRDDGSLVVGLAAQSTPGVVYLFRESTAAGSGVPGLSLAGTLLAVLLVAVAGVLALRRLGSPVGCH